MFNKKNELPPWPKPPTNNQVLEDISNAAKDDPVFTEFGKQVTDSAVRSNVEVTYDLVKQFLDVSNKLENSVEELEKKNDSLKASSEELQRMADDLRQQAVDALSKFE